MSPQHLLALSFTLSFALVPQVRAETGASIRPLTSIDRSVVEVRDLFRNAGPNADVILGPAPSPGQQIKVGARQLDAIARQYGVPWHADVQDLAAVVERQGVPITPAQIGSALRAALTQAGAPPHSAVTISGGELPMVPPNATPHVMVSSLTFGHVDDDFRATVVISASGMNAVTKRIDGMAVPAVEGVSAIHRLSPGDILNSADLQRTWIPVAAMPQGAIRKLSQAIGMQVKRMIAKGAPVSRQAIAQPTLIARGSTVRLAVDMPGLEVTAQGIALAAGGAGSAIPVLNPTSREVVQAVIDGVDRAHVVPGTMPMPSRGVPYYQGIGTQP